MTGLIAMNKAYLMLAFTNHKHDVCWGLVLATHYQVKMKDACIAFCFKNDLFALYESERGTIYNWVLRG